MTKFIITRGISASGKSTWAKDYCEKNVEFHIVNRDALRLNMIEDGEWNRSKEKGVIAERDRLIIYCLNNKISVISDDTNLSEKTFNHLKQLGEKCDAEIIVQDFRNVPLEDCIKRDSKRKNKVGKDVILEQYYRYIHKPVKPVWNPDLDSCMICDLDGTLALIPKGKNPYDRDFENDDVNHHVLEILKASYNNVSKIWFLSGRKSKFMNETRNFLINKCKLDPSLYRYGLVMRSNEDNRPDYIFKKEMYDTWIKDKYNVRYVFDDRKQVKRMWVNEGLFVFDVNQFDSEF